MLKYWMKINGTYGCPYPTLDLQAHGEGAKALFENNLVYTLNLFLFVSLEFRALGVLKKKIMNTRLRLMGKIIFLTESLMLQNIQEQSQRYI